MKKFKISVFTFIYLFSVMVNAAATRTIPADAIKSSDATKTWTMPGATGTLATQGNAETLSQKTLPNPTIDDALVMTEEASSPSSPSAGFKKVYCKNDGKCYTKNSSGAEVEIGAGAGNGGGINYITNSDIETNITGHTAYADAAAASPVDGTGGSPTLTVAQSTSTPLRGAADALITKDAANRQGEGIGINFTIDSADAINPKMQVLEFDYEYSANFTCNDGTTSSPSDIVVYVYDRDNAQLIQPVPYILDCSGKFVGSFQNNKSADDYTLILHIATTDATAYTFNYDNIKVGPQNTARGPPVTDWVSWTPTTTSFGTPTNVTARWRRVGSNLEMQGRFTTGTTTSATPTISLPAGLSIDPAVVATSVTNVGIYTRAGTSTVQHGGFLLASSGGTTLGFSDARTFDGVSLDVLSAITGASTHGNGEFLSFTATVPIAGWGSNTTLSSDAGSRTIAMFAYGPSNAAASANAPIKWPNVTRDTHAAYNASSGLYTAPETGWYQVSFSSDGTTSANWGQYIAVNGCTAASATCPFAANPATANGMIFGSGQVYVTAGQTIAIHSTNTYGAGSSAGNYLSIHKIASPQSLAGTEDVIAKYSTAAGQTITSGAISIINFGTKEKDTHNAVTTGASWKFTAPVSGEYEVNAHTLTDNTAGAAPFRLEIYKGGSIAKYVGYQIAPATSRSSPNGTAMIKLLQGEYIDVRFNNGDSGTRTLHTDGQFNYVEIKRVGNY